MATKLKILLYTLIVGNFLLLQSCKTNTANTGQAAGEKIQNEQLVSERLKLKNAAFCACLSKSSVEMNSLITQDGSSAGYLETSAYSIDAFGAVFQAAENYAKKEYNSKYGKNLAVMKCLDFYNSKQLQELIISLDGELPSEIIK